MNRNAPPVDLARAIVRREIIHLAPLVDVARVELGVSHVRSEAGVCHMPLPNSESVTRLYNRIGRHPEEKGTIHTASHAELLRDDMHGAVAAVADEDRIFARPQNNLAVFTVIDRHLLAVVEDFIDGVTVVEQEDEMTGLSSTVVIDPKQRGSAGKDLRPTAKLVDGKGKEICFANTDLPAVYALPPGALVSMSDGDKVSVGDVIARIPQESSKTRDITGGLPRVADLFEARKPKEPAILAEATGTVSFGKETKGKRRPVITTPDGRSIQVVNEPLADGGWLATHEDVTERRRAEAA